MYAVIGLSLGVLVALAFIITFDKLGKVYINKGWTDKNTLKVDSLKLKVESVKRVVGCNGYWVAEYKATSYYRTKKDVDYQTIIFYDEIGKYNIGDILELTKL